MSSPIADIIIPTHDHALLLPMSVASVQQQTVEDIRIHIVGDGVGDDTRDVVASLQKSDTRVLFHDHPKSPRTGEQYRDEIARLSGAKVITYLGDDDLMAPDHVDEILVAVQEFDVVFPLHTSIDTSQQIHFETYSLAEQHWRDLYLEGNSLFSLTGLCHTPQIYRALPEGWTNTPIGFYTDMYMILKFIKYGNVRFGMTSVPTVLHFPSDQRHQMSMIERSKELQVFHQRFSSLASWTKYRTHLFDQLREVANFRQIELLKLQQNYLELHDAYIAKSQEVNRISEILILQEQARIIKIRNYLLKSKLLRIALRIRS